MKTLYSNVVGSIYFFKMMYVCNKISPALTQDETWDSWLLCDPQEYISTMPTSNTTQRKTTAKSYVKYLFQYSTKIFRKLVQSAIYIHIMENNKGLKQWGFIWKLLSICNRSQNLYCFKSVFLITILSIPMFSTLYQDCEPVWRQGNVILLPSVYIRINIF